MFTFVEKNTLKVNKIKKDKVNVVTLGCSKNLVDSENIITQLSAGNLDVEHQKHDDDTNVVIVNTCGFIDVAKEESVNTILEYAKAKESGMIEKLYVTGCLSQRYREQLAAEIPEVDAWFGTLELPALLEKFKVDYKHELLGDRKITTPPHFAYLKISEGCNRTCSFCAIPLIRGKHVSVPIERLVEQAKNHAARGVKELILIAQELTYYGLDIYKKRSLSTLLQELVKVDGIQWIRLHYSYPNKFPMEILQNIRQEIKICNYLDIPLQHISDKMLEKMHRQITKQETLSLISSIRTQLPDAAIRTTFLVGHPGEEEEDLDEIIEFIKKYKFDRVGVFTYSHEEGTSAHDLEDIIPESVKQERANRIMEVQREISLELNQNKIGNTYKVLIDRKEGEFFVGRTEFDSPEVDNEVLINAKENFARVGDFVNVNITGAEEYDLFGDVVS